MFIWNKKKNVVKIKEEVETIYISSDEEVIEEVEDPLGEWGWSKEVTKAIANWRKPQTLHVPAWIVQQVIYDKTSICLESLDNGRNYLCSVMTPADRGMFVRYIGDGWYCYLEDLKPRIGDKLKFIVPNPPDYLMVKLIRNEDRR
ncbi:hypothetical protein A2U01_0024179 [Trifolium medium]|uniref:TF-B3 domain-containing protein n=1 Tax=Trifolium medium TaxID=97028 RepID=A0A392NUP7_9FABA|nr:hypothetical protein [Trifolium medium]